MKMIFLLLIILAVPTLAQAQDQTALEAAGCGPKNIQFDVKTDKKSHPKGQLEPDKALVYVFDNISGIAIGGFPASRVGVDGTWVGANYKKSYFFFSVAPGAHNLCVDRMVTTFTAEPGQSRYFAVGLPLYPGGFYKVNEISPAEAELQIGSLAHSTFTQKPAKSANP